MSEEEFAYDVDESELTFTEAEVKKIVRLQWSFVFRRAINKVLKAIDDEEIYEPYENTWQSYVHGYMAALENVRNDVMEIWNEEKD